MIVMGRYGIVSELFELVNGPSAVVKNRFGTYRECSGLYNIRIGPVTIYFYFDVVPC